MRKGYTTDFFKQFEELNYKLDNLLEENKMMKSKHKKEIKNLLKEFEQEKAELKETVETLSKQLDTANKVNEQLLNEIDRLKNQINKNSNNSSKPPSTDINSSKKKTGANQYNYRKITGKKPGGQKGHVGHCLSKEKIEKLIKQDEIKVKEVYHVTNNRSKKDIVKYRLGMDVNVYVEKHIFKHDENSEEKLPKEFYTDVTYDSKIKALSIDLGIYNVVAYNRMSDFFYVISEGKIEISNGTLVNFTKEFSSNSKGIIRNFENEILNSKIMLTDETSSKCKKEKIYIRNYSNENTILYKNHKNKGHKAIKEQNILPRFTGGIVHDHDTTMYSYGRDHYECIVHLGRYLEEIIENVKNITWPKLLKEMMFEAYKKRKELQKKDVLSFTKEEIEEYERKYDEIMVLSKEENKQIKSSFYKDKAKTLSKRCEKYKENHLAFMKDFSVPFDNNASERALRIVKNKTKISGGFRSEKGCEYYCDAITIINTAKTRNINPFHAIVSVFNKENIFAS